jgi:hypothetical protein
MTNILGIQGIEITLGQGKVIYRIQQVGLARPIITHKAIDLIAEIQFQLIKIFKIDKRNMGNVHVKILI